VLRQYLFKKEYDIIAYYYGLKDGKMYNCRRLADIVLSTPKRVERAQFQALGKLRSAKDELLAIDLPLNPPPEQSFD
jgi:DNA-directed RNA polymerase sigma subunit (sigma70/sigma32)